MNGEYNELRNMGYKRPVNVLKIKSDIRAKYSKMGEKKLFKMINPRGTVSTLLISRCQYCFVNVLYRVC